MNVLGGVAAGEGENGHTKPGVAKDLTGKIQEVAKIRDTSDVSHSMTDLDMTRFLSSKELVIEAPLDEVCLETLFDLSYAILLSEIQATFQSMQQEKNQTILPPLCVYCPCSRNSEWNSPCVQRSRRPHQRWRSWFLIMPFSNSRASNVECWDVVAIAQLVAIHHSPRR
jgi:hypothetical protein